MFSFGAGQYGQLGHNSKSDETQPRKIMELMGTEATQIGKKKLVKLIIFLLKLISRIFQQFAETSTLWFLFLLVDVSTLLDWVWNIRFILLLRFMKIDLISCDNEGGCGQLGNGAYSSSTTPQVVHGPWISPSGEPSFPKKVDNDKKYNVLRISKCSIEFF